jgi:hypothetical protein
VPRERVRVHRALRQIAEPELRRLAQPLDERREIREHRRPAEHRALARRPVGAVPGDAEDQPVDRVLLMLVEVARQRLGGLDLPQQRLVGRKPQLVGQIGDLGDSALRQRWHGPVPRRTTPKEKSPAAGPPR